MKQKRTSALLTLILGILILGFVAFTHVVSTLVVLPGAPAGFSGFVQALLNNVVKVFVIDFAIREQLIGFIFGVVGVGLAIIFAVVWAIRLLVYRRRPCNLLSPLFFLIAVFVGVVLISSHYIIEVAFDQNVAMVPTAYWFVLGVLIVALGLHLLVVGLVTSGSRKEKSLLEEEVAEEEEKAEEEVLEEEKEEEKAKVDLEDPELEALIRKLANEEIDKREPVVVEKVVEKKAEPAPKAEPAKVVAAPAPAKPAKKPTPERIAFPDRMQMVDESVKADYNVLKNYLLSYGLNSRVSNVGDSFRSGRVLYARLTNSGNSGLKLYLPINLDDYKDSKIPLKSAEGVKQYEDVPVFIYVRSDLSMKRALQLIDDVMEKNGIAKKFEPETTDHVKELK